MLSFPFVSKIVTWFVASAPEDPITKLITKITTSILLFSGTITGGVTYLGDSFECMLPMTYSPDWGAFAESRCFWADVLFYIPEDADYHRPVPNGKKWGRTYYWNYVTISYYPYASFYLMIAALACLSPSFVWKWLLRQCEIPLEEIISKVKTIKRQTKADRRSIVEELGDLIIEKVSAAHTRYFCGLPKPRFIQCYHFLKSYNFMLLLVQFFAFAQVFDHNLGLDWGWKMFWYSFVSNEKAQCDIQSFFPRQVICEYKFKNLEGTYRDEGVECLLTFNPFIQKCFILIWFWYTLIIVVSLINAIYFISVGLWNKSRTEKELMNSVEALILTKGDLDKMKFYVNVHLTLDQILIYEFIERKCILTAEEVTLYCFSKWAKHSNENKKENCKNENPMSVMPYES